MVKKVINKVENTPVISETREISDKVLFSPTDAMKRAKAQFWSRYRSGPVGISMSIAAEVTNHPKIKTWWAKEGFREWFSNREEERERLKYLFNKSLDSLEQILDNPEANPNAKANIIKMLAEMNGYLNKKTVEKFADEDINKMSQSQLEEFLKNKGVRIVQEKVINAKAEDK